MLHCDIMFTRSAYIFILSMFFVFLFFGIAESKKSIRPSKAHILSPPHDVPVAKCGDDIKLTCMAQGNPSPDIEWWFQEKQPAEQRTKTVLRNAGKDGRVKIKTEEFYLVRSTIIISDADESDEGIYQCRASNSKLRNKDHINLLQHWRIEQAPVNQVLCRDAVTVQTQVFSAANYNQSVFDDIINQTMSSLNDFEETTTGMVLDAKDKENSQPDGPLPKPPQEVTSQVIVPSIIPSVTQGNNDVKEPVKPKKSVFVDTKTKKSSRNMVKQDKPKKKRNKVVVEDRTMAVMSPTTEKLSDDLSDRDGGNSGRSIYSRSSVLMLIHLPLLVLLKKIIV